VTPPPPILLSGDERERSTYAINIDFSDFTLSLGNPRIKPYLTGYGLKYRGARGTPRTRGSEADGTKIMTAARPQHLHNTRACGRQNGGSTVQCARPVRLPPTCAPRHTRRRHGVQVQEQLCRRALHARANGLDAADHLLCEGAVCTRVRDRLLRRCHAAPKRCGSELEL
jgi:hypothetical protein